MASTTTTLQMVRKVIAGRRNDHGGVSERGMLKRWADTFNGLLGEIAVCRALNLPWHPGSRSISYGEVGGVAEARATDHHGGHMLVYNNDADGKWILLAVGCYPRFRLVGGMKAALAKRAEWWRSDADPPCFWVPQDSLLPLATIMESLK